MRLSAIISTVIHLTPEQIMFQVIKRIHTPKFKLTQHPDTVCFKHSTHPIPKPVSLSGSIFTFLNVSSGLIAWDDDSHGPLWAYNLNYMDWIGRYICGFPWWLSSKESVNNAGNEGLISGSGVPLEKEMAIRFSILAWKIPWPEEPVGLQSMGSQRVRHDWTTLHFHMA